MTGTRIELELLGEGCRIGPLIKNTLRVTDTGWRMLAVIRRNPGIRAGAAGYEMWHKPGHRCKPENNQNTMFCRQAGKVLRQLRIQGLVNCRQDGPALKWTCTEAGIKELEKEPT